MIKVDRTEFTLANGNTITRLIHNISGKEIIAYEMDLLGDGEVKIYPADCIANATQNLMELSELLHDEYTRELVHEKR